MAMAQKSLFCCFVLMVLWFGKSSGAEETEIGVYELKRGDFSVKFTNFGATVLSLILPDKNGYTFF